jgi:hypothetical protein
MKVKDLEAGTQPVSFLCRPALKADIQMVAALDGISQADVIRRAVLADIRKRKVENVIGRDTALHEENANGQRRPRTDVSSDAQPRCCRRQPAAGCRDPLLQRLARSSKLSANPTLILLTRSRRKRRRSRQSHCLARA